MNKPHFFIIGAPRCGTTSLYTWLHGHENIFLPDVKEPFFWCSDFPRMQTVSTEAEYLRMFKKAGPEKTMCGEASTLYFYSRAAPQAIHRFDPTARIVVLLRNPVDLVYSWHSWLLSCFDEDEPDFERAWALIEERRAGRCIPKRCRFPALLDYEQIGQLATWLRRWLASFSAAQVKCLLLDDLGRSPEMAYRQVLDFLGLRYDGRTEFPHVNDNREHRIRWLALLQERKPPWLARITGRIKQRVPQGVYNACRFDIRQVKRAPMPPVVRWHLSRLFSAELRDLEELLQRDLTFWKQASPSAQTAAEPNAGTA